MAEIEKSTKTVRNTTYGASGTFVASAGQNVKLETTPTGSEIFDDDVPAGKEWRCKLTLEIHEVDV